MARKQDDEQTVIEPRNELGDLATLENAGDDVTWYVYRLASDGKVLPPGVSNEDGLYVLRFTGRFELDRLRDELGGGFYRVLGRTSDGTFVARARFGIDAPLKSPMFAPGAATTTAPAAPVSAEITELRRELSELRLSLGGSRGAGMTTKDLLDAIRLGGEMRGGTAATTPAVQLGELMQIFDRGIELGQQSGGDGESWVSVAKQYLPAVIDLFTTRRSPATAIRTPAAAPPPGAQAGFAATPAAPDGGQRMMLELIARAIAGGRDPASYCDTIEDLLTELELAQLRSLTDDQVLAVVHAHDAIFPAFAQPGADEWVRAFMLELRTPPEE